MTDRARLRRRVGAFAGESLARLSAQGHAVLDLAGETRPERAIALVRKAPASSGVVLLGGPGVVPPHIVDAIPNRLRRLVQGAQDPDDFYVWSDDHYGDRNGDDIPELPVSRVPDAGSAAFLRRVLFAQAPSAARAAGYRNIHRPFADAVYATLTGRRRPMVRSMTATPRTVGAIGGGRIYLMMHGSPFDGTRLWGENAAEQPFLAVRSSNVGDVRGATVFAGCCWGAMVWTPMAKVALGGGRLVARTPGNSIALRFLSRGARVFIGPTAAHYSPTGSFWRAAGGPLHMAFWKYFSRGTPPAQALFLAKRDYAQWMHGRRLTPENLAICFKVLREFTCLGWGWS